MSIKSIEADHYFSYDWGNTIKWFNKEEFDCAWTEDSRFSINGHKKRIPKVGQTVAVEMETYYTVFVITDIKKCSDPEDQFFGKVAILKQYDKETLEEKASREKDIVENGNIIWRRKGV